MREPSDYVDAARDRLAELGAEPVVIGALAALRYRLDPRATTDVDLLVTRLDGVPEALERDGFSVRVIDDDDGRPYLVYARNEEIQIDALLVETEYQREAHRRAADGFLTVEDVIVHKLIAWRARDRDDIESILSAGHALDESYIEHWAAEWEVLDRWRGLRSPSGP